MPERDEDETGARLSIGALSRATEIPVETLRTWENRYGFPVPERRPSGHRLYPLSIVPRLRRIAEALAGGHRARQVVPASDADLRRLLASPRRTAAIKASGPSGVAPLLALVQAYASDRLTLAFRGAAARLGPLAFAETVAAPLLRAVGEGWENGTLEVRHEHFVSERLGDVLRSLRLPLEERAAGPLVVLSTPPGEGHALGLQMAAVVLAAAGSRVLYLGAETPLPDLVTLARDLGARALGLSVSASSPRARTAAQVRRLRRQLPRRTALILGGEGAVKSAGVRVFADLPSLDDWARGIAARR